MGDSKQKLTKSAAQNSSATNSVFNLSSTNSISFSELTFSEAEEENSQDAQISSINKLDTTFLSEVPADNDDDLPLDALLMKKNLTRPHNSGNNGNKIKFKYWRPFLD